LFFSLNYNNYFNQTSAFPPSDSSYNMSNLKKIKLMVPSMCVIIEYNYKCVCVCVYIYSCDFFISKTSKKIIQKKIKEKKMG
jgi:hypothetical protein